MPAREQPEPAPSATNDGSSDEKVHPSEFLEFATIHGDGRIGAQNAPIQKDGLPDGGDGKPSQGEPLGQMSDTVPDISRLSADARTATQTERKMTFMDGCRLYPKAMAWSFVLSATIIMEGFDTALVNSFFAFPIFRRTYGDPVHHQLSAAWQTGLQNGTITGQIIGLFLNGWLTHRLGYLRTMQLALIWLCLFVFLAFFAVNIEMLLASQILCGVPWGIFQTLTVTYAAEIMPITLRGYLISNVNMCWLFGQITAVGILRGVLRISSKWSFRIPFGMQWAFALPILILSTKAPESPSWLVRRGRLDEAKRSLLRLTSRNAGNFDADLAISMLRHTDEVEKYIGEGTSYQSCFKGSNLRRTEIACAAWSTQALCGLSLMSFAAYFFENAGLSSANAFNFSVGMYALGIVGNMIAWALLPRVGRRRLYLCGLSAMLIVLIAGGSVGAALPNSQNGSWAVGACLVMLTAIYDVTVGPVCYVIVAEVPSTRLRIKTVVLARVAYNIFTLLTNYLTPRMLNPQAWDWAGKANFLYAATTIPCLVWCYFRLPETAGLSYLELDILFDKKAKTRQFKEFQKNLADSGYFGINDEQRHEAAFTGY